MSRTHEPGKRVTALAGERQRVLDVLDGEALTGPATLAGTLSQAAVGGIATFADLSVTLVGTGYTLDATDGLLTGATSTTFDITPAAADHLAFVQQPTTTVAGVAIAPAVTVRVIPKPEAAATVLGGGVALEPEEIAPLATTPPTITTTSAIPPTMNSGARLVRFTAGAAGAAAPK